MMTILHPTYTLRVDVQDKPREAGQPVQNGESMSGRRFAGDFMEKTGCDEVLEVVRDALTKAGLKHFRVSFDKYEHRGNL